MNKETCAADQCTSQAQVRGHCRIHYGRMWHSGEIKPLRPRPRSKSLREAWERGLPADRTTGDCWIWQGAYNGKGYGIVWFNYEKRFAHRFSYDLYFPGLTPELVVRHLCHVPACVQPHHLEVGTHADNVRDCVESGRNTRGEMMGTSKLTEGGVIQVREMLKGGASQRSIGEIFGVSQAAICSINAGKTWKHVPMPEAEVAA